MPALAAVAWFVLLPQWRPSLHDGERYGVDVSSHQGAIGWEDVAADGIEAAYIKATEGADFVDRRFARNWSDAAAAGIQRGAYHFFTLCSGGAEQARHFLATAPPDASALAPAVDLELAGNCHERPGSSVVDGELRAFLSAVEAAWGRPALLYIGDDFKREYFALVSGGFGRPRWARRLARRPDGPWSVWQVGGFSKVDGIPGRVDLDVWAS